MGHQEERLEVAGEPRLLRVPAASRGARSVGRAGARRCAGLTPSRRLCSLPPSRLCKEPLPKGTLGAHRGEPLSERTMTNCLISSSAFNPSFPFLPPHPSPTQSLLSPRQPAVRAGLAVPGHFVSLDLRLFPFPVLP